MYRYLALAAVLGLIVMTKKSSGLRYFKPEEFRGWYGKTSPKLLEHLDEFRHLWGAPVIISQHQDAIGRESETDRSQHNALLWGEVRAVDVFPKVEVSPGVYRWMQTKEERQRAYDIALKVGFTGVGIYTDTTPGNMMHFDVRGDRVPGHPATWARLVGAYVGINEVIG